jgi:hypothetical protein
MTVGYISNACRDLLIIAEGKNEYLNYMVYKIKHADGHAQGHELFNKHSLLT